LLNSQSGSWDQNNFIKSNWKKYIQNSILNRFIVEGWNQEKKILETGIKPNIKEIKKIQSIIPKTI